MQIQWLVDGGISVPEVKKPKKITGTRFGAILGKSPWATPFEMWCECTKTYQEKFEDNIYTLAGKAIEPKQIEYVKSFVDGVVSPEDMFGKDYFNKCHGDFFHDPVFGGMWDALIFDENNEVETVLEFKTTQRVEDWEDDIPEYYALQAALYAYLLKCDEVMLVCSVLEEKDYAIPENYDVNAKNTFTRSFKISERYPDFEKMISFAENWYKTFVLTGNSPIPEERDAELLKMLKKVFVTADDNTQALIHELEGLKRLLDENEAKIKDYQNRYKAIADELKIRFTADKTEGEIIELQGNAYVITYTPSRSTAIDTKKLQEDGLYEKYSYQKPVTYTMRIKEKK